MLLVLLYLFSNNFVISLYLLFFKAYLYVLILGVEENSSTEYKMPALNFSHYDHSFHQAVHALDVQFEPKPQTLLDLHSLHKKLKHKSTAKDDNEKHQIMAKNSKATINCKSCQVQWLRVRDHLYITMSSRT